MTDTAMVSERRSPASDIDLWSDEVIEYPYPAYKELRDAGPAVWLNRQGAWAVARHGSVREALLNGQAFTSTGGVAMNQVANNAAKGIMLVTDDPEHLRLRKVFSRPLMPKPVAGLQHRLISLAQERVAELLAQGEFDAVADLANFLPLTVVSELVGLGEEGKRNMLAWAAGLFNGLGPENNARTASGLEITGQAFGYLQGVDRDELDQEGWGAALFRAADAGELTPVEARAMLMDYLGPALDTTINGLSSALWLFARHPDQWDLVRAQPDQVNRAIDEVLRLESPIRGFARVLTRNYQFDDVTLAKGDRALILYASANRDERRYSDPDRFDVTRNAADHVAFGYGTHLCAGRHLGKMEISTVLNMLIPTVRRFHVLEEVREPHNTLRGLAKLQVRIERD